MRNRLLKKPKWILKQIYEPQLPTGLAQRRKCGFELPVDEWLRGPLKSQFQDVVLQESSSIADFIDPAEADRMYQQHCRHIGQHGQVLWSLLVLGRWLEMWGSPQSAPAVGAPDNVCEVV